MTDENNKAKLTDTDMLILDALVEDGTISYAALGKKIGMSATGAHDRVRKLKQQGVIERISAVISPKALNRSFLCFVKLKLADVNKSDKAKSLMKFPEILEIHNIAGEFSILCKIRAADTEHMEKILAKIYAIPGIIQSETTVVFGTYTERSMNIRGTGKEKG